MAPTSSKVMNFIIRWKFRRIFLNSGKPRPLWEAQIMVLTEQTIRTNRVLIIHLLSRSAKTSLKMCMEIITRKSCKTSCNNTIRAQWVVAHPAEVTFTIIPDTTSKKFTNKSSSCTKETRSRHLQIRGRTWSSPSLAQVSLKTSLKSLHLEAQTPPLTNRNKIFKICNRNYKNSSCMWLIRVINRCLIKWRLRRICQTKTSSSYQCSTITCRSSSRLGRL